MKVRNTFIIFLVSGFWHGANWTFIVWGGLNALYFLPLLLLKRNRTNLGVVAEGRMLPNLRELFQMGTTFLLTVLAWVFFRSNRVEDGVDIVKEIISPSVFLSPEQLGYSQIMTVGFITFMLMCEWRHRSSLFVKFSEKNKTLSTLGYIIIIILLFQFVGTEQQFIYFQF